MSEFTIIGKVLNMYHTIHSAGSLYKLMNTYGEIDVFKKKKTVKILRWSPLEK